MKPIHNLLRQRLYRTQKPIIEHPPIDLLSAFSERALGGSDRAPVLEHLSHCQDCREIVFLSAPQMQAESTSGATGRRASPWLSWPVLRWGAAAACAVIVVAAVQLRPGYHETPPAKSVTAAHKLSTVNGNVAAVAHPPATETRSAENSNSTPTIARRLQNMPGRAKAVPRASASRANDSHTNDADNDIAGNFDPQASFAPSAAPGNDDSTSLPPRWTITTEGTLQGSMDGGITWQPVRFSHDYVFRTVAASGQSIWLGGRNGVLFHSGDRGRHWSQLKPTAKRKLPTSDIVKIEFEDDQNGKLTTADNESWTTSDAGRSWQKQ
ncbi:MAG: YCF48-related protein [Terriglobales bacterium]